MKTYSNSDTRWQLRTNLVTYWRQAIKCPLKDYLFYVNKYQAACEALMLSPHEASKLIDLYTVRSYTHAC